jgi:hypothetical protein
MWECGVACPGNFIHTEGSKKYFAADQVKEEKVESKSCRMRLCQSKHIFAGIGVALGSWSGDLGRQLELC